MKYFNKTRTIEQKVIDRNTQHFQEKHVELLEKIKVELRKK